MPKYWITKPRYLQQVGETEPHYVDASAHAPALVELPDDVEPDRGLRPVEAKPEKPMTGFVKKQSDTTRKVGSKKDSGKRAADQ